MHLKDTFGNDSFEILNMICCHPHSCKACEWYSISIRCSTLAWRETKNAQPHTPGRHLYSHLPTHTLMSLHLHTNTEKQHREQATGKLSPEKITSACFLPERQKQIILLFLIIIVAIAQLKLQNRTDNSGIKIHFHVN